MKKIALLSHKLVNIGHLFMEIGVREVINNIFGKNVEITNFEQHKPFSIYPKYNPLYYLDKKGIRSFKSFRYLVSKSLPLEESFKYTKKLNYDIAICCGGPNIAPLDNFPKKSKLEFSLLLHNMNGAFNFNNVPVCDFAVGSSFPLNAKSFSFSNSEKIFIKNHLLL